MLYNILMFAQELSQPVMLPHHFLLQNKVSVGKYTCVEQTRFITVEEISRIAEEDRKCLESVARFRFEIVDIDIVRVFPKLIPCGLLQLDCQRGTDDSARCREIYV